jgi:hypothetical protein
MLDVRMLNGQHSMDDICTTFGYSIADMHEILLKEKAVRFIWK